jgi:hypothetical protein
LFFSIRVIDAEGGVNVGAGHGALASVGEHELAAFGLRLGFRREVQSVVATVGVGLRSEAWRRNMVGVRGERFGRGCGR